MTSRLETGKQLTFFYSVHVYKLLLSGQVLAVFVSEAAAGKQAKGVATNFAVWTRDTKVIIYKNLKDTFFYSFSLS